MDNVLISLLILFFYVKQESYLAIALRKFVHQKDMSEHCKRRVLPSIFLGSQVMEASSQVMHFSQLEVPYSCFLSVRAESGNNIILVIQLLSENSLMEACAQNSNQLAVYELGETFGGYWGPQPDVLFKPTTKNYTRYYTLKTTRPINTERTRRYKEITQKILTQTFPVAADKEPDYIRLDVPLVNVSGNLQLSGPLRHTHDAEEMFDFIYDVTPRNGLEYETSIMPLVQFSIKPQKNGIYGYGDGIRRYELDYDVRGFTLDSRLTFNTISRRNSLNKIKWSSNRKYNLGKKNTTLFARKNTALKYQKFLTRQSSLSFNSTIKNTIIPTLDSKYSTSSWKFLDDIIEYFNMTSIRSTEVENTTIRNILHDIANAQHNLSVYLFPNISAYINKTSYIKRKDRVKLNSHLKISTRRDLRPILLRSHPLQMLKTSTRLFTSSIKKSNNITLDGYKFNTDNYWSTESLLVKSSLHHSLMDINKNYKNKNDTKEKTDTNMTLKTDVMKSVVERSTSTLIQTGTMVDHESWENIVQAAPVMAIVLNKTDPLSNNKTNATNLDEKVQKSKRKKRYIKSLRIENSRPRNMTSKRPMSTDTETIFRFSDIQDLARLVELQDDGIEGRVALRYLKNYVGSPLYNICDFSEPKSRQTFLFNASRIVIAISNFTLDHVMLVVTPAQSLQNSMSHCSSGQLECQVVGTRVCIDSTNSCDGVPNCGSFDIYDEDRLLCGVAKDLQHNVYLAAFTFLAVLLTMLFTVHYWLKRCVPRVSEAFFIYTDTSENTLFLDTIMRSPTDVDDTSCNLMFSGHYFDNDILYEDKETHVEGNLCKKIFKKCCGFLFFKRKREETHFEDNTVEYESSANKPTRMFSFTEMELRKFTPIISKNEAVQTISGYDPDKNIVEKTILQRQEIVKDSITNFQTISRNDDFENELNLIKFSKEIRSSSLQSDTFSFDKKDIKMDRRHAIIPEDEREIKSTFYDHQSNKPSVSERIPVLCDIHTERPKKRAEVKRLRFKDVPTMIPSVENEEENIEGTTIGRRSVVLGVGHLNKQDLDTITQIEESNSASKDFMRFWSAKGKMGKKKEKNLSKR